MNKKMADVDIDPFGGIVHPASREHKSIPEEPMGENIPLIPEEGGGSTWEPEHEQETSFRGGLTQERRVTNSYVDTLCKELSKHYSQNYDATHYDNFRCKGKWLHFRGRDEPLTNEDGKLKTEAYQFLCNTLCKELSKYYSQNFDATRYDNFRCKGKWLYF